MSNAIFTPNAPEAVGPYSQAVASGSFLFVSGQLAINPVTGEIEAKTVSEQCAQCLKNLRAILEAAGSSMDKVVRATVYITDMNSFGAANEIYAQYFTGPVLPARVCFEVSALPKGGLIEIDAVAEM